MDASLRFYVNSSSEIVEEQHQRPRLERAAQQDALLVAAGKTSYRLVQSVGSYAYLSHAIRGDAVERFLRSQVGGIRATTADPMLNDTFCSSHSPPFLRSGGM